MASGIPSIGVGAPVIVTGTPGPSLPGSVPGAPVHPVVPVLPIAGVGHGGNPPPPAGEPLPAQTAAAQSGVIQLQAAIEGVNKFLRDNQRQMVFQVDTKSGQTIVTIVNPATGEVIRQIPSAQVLAAAANLQQAGMPMAGLFVNERA